MWCQRAGGTESAGGGSGSGSGSGDGPEHRTNIDKSTISADNEKHSSSERIGENSSGERSSKSKTGSSEEVDEDQGRRSVERSPRALAARCLSRPSDEPLLSSLLVTSL